MATLLYGGGFNPITHAHLLTAREAMERGGFSEVIFIPTGYDGYKKGGMPFAHRLEMLKLAIDGHDNFHFSDWEGQQAKQLGRMIYTIETFRYMQENQVAAKLRTSFPV
jgi:nicotinate-nucleotide adenylyltransferase